MSSDSESETETDREQPDPSCKKQKKIYKQHFKKEWTKLPSLYWLESSKKGTFFAWCNICKCDISISAGKVQLLKHSESEKHIKLFREAQTSGSREQSIVSLFAKSNKQRNLKEKAKEGIIRTAGFLTEHNLAFNLMEHFIDFINSVCPDSEIAKQMKAERTKITRVIKKVTADSQRNCLIEKMRCTRFSIIADESTDISCVKHLCLIARMLTEHKVEDNFLELIPLKETTGAALYDLLINFFKKNDIPYKSNFIGFASDGASNMVGTRNSVVSRLHDEIPGIYTMKCICHSFHLCASYACQKIPEEVEQLTREVYNYFSNSPKRFEDFKEFQEYVNVNPAKILHPSQTRWLSLGSVVKRILNQYNALTLYFIDLSSTNISQAHRILEKLNKPENKLYLGFLSRVLPIFNNLNKLMQSESPKIHILYTEVVRAVKTFLDFYIKDEVITSTSVENIDSKNRDNFLKLEEMYFSADINSSNLESSQLDQVKLNCLSFYIESVNQIYMRFPLENSKFRNLEFMDPEIIKSRQIRTIGNISKLFPNLIEIDIQAIDDEWLALRNFEIDFATNDICEFWMNIAQIKSVDKTGPRFPNLTKFVFDLLTLPVSSANVERVFSQINLNKTKQRNRLKTSTIAGVLHTKSLVSKNNTICANFPISKDLIEKLNQNIYDSSDSD